MNGIGSKRAPSYVYTVRLFDQGGALVLLCERWDMDNLLFTLPPESRVELHERGYLTTAGAKHRTGHCSRPWHWPIAAVIRVEPNRFVRCAVHHSRLVITNSIRTSLPPLRATLERVS